MKGVLEFDLPAEQEEFQMAQQGVQWKVVVEDMDNWLREQLRYRSDEYDTIEIKLLEKTRAKLLELVDDDHLVLHP